MKVKHLSYQDYKVSHWSGGKTTELFIYPLTADYQKRDFLFRISSATVEEERSDFTYLQQIDRVLILLKGEMKLVHEGHYTKALAPYDQDSFEGDWHTISYGKATDFNLMIKRTLRKQVDVITVPVAMKETIDNKKTNWLRGIYCAEGQIEIMIDEAENYTLREGELLLVWQEGESIIYKLHNRANQEAKLITIEIE